IFLPGMSIIKTKIVSENSWFAFCFNVLETKALFFHFKMTFRLKIRFGFFNIIILALNFFLRIIQQEQ
uniref:Uncharacterized protein n=1 Tax=Pelodiscus sinensis TaxID=13735 RepID=K7FRG1_PELSI